MSPLPFNPFPPRTGHRNGDGRHEWAESVGLRLDGDLSPANLESTIDGVVNGVPSYAGQRQNRFDPATGVYNWKASNTRRLRASLGKAAAGMDRCVHAFIGDSITEASVGVPTFSFTDNWPISTKKTLVSLGIPSGGDGFVKAGNTPVGLRDPRLTFSGGWTVSPAFSSTTTNGAVATFAFTEAGTTVEVGYLGTSGGTFTVRIDGVIPTGGNITADGSTNKLRAVFSGLTDTVHTVTITSTSTTAIFILGVSSYKASGVVPNVFGYSGTDAITSWRVNSEPYTLARCAEVTATFGGTPAVVHIALGINDIKSNGSAPSAIVAALTLIRNLFPNSDVVLHGQTVSSLIPQATWEAYLSALYGLADTLDCPLIDWYRVTGGYATAVADGLMGDDTHPNLAFHKNLGRRIGMLETR